MIIGLTGLGGIGLGDFTDRFLATHAFTVSTTQGGSMDAPVVGQVYNYQAAAAPMGWKRWAAGAAGTAVPLVIGAYIKGPGWRAAFQGVGIGWGLGTLGRGLRDLMVMLFGKTAFGMRMWADEISAANAAKTAKAATTAVTAVVPVSLAGVRHGQRIGTNGVAGCSNCAGCSCPNCKITTSNTATPGTSGVPATRQPPATVAASPQNPAPTAAAPPAAAPPGQRPALPPVQYSGGWRSRIPTSVTVPAR